MAMITGGWKTTTGVFATYPCVTYGPYATSVTSHPTSNQRSETIKRVRDASGWRDPTPYWREVYSGNGKGTLAICRLSGLVKSLINPTFVCPFVTYHGLPYLPSANFQQLPAFPSGLSARAVNEALLQLKDSEHRNTAPNLSEAFGERREAMRMVTARVKQLANAVKYARSHNWKEVARSLSTGYKRLSTKDWANGWLEYQYGWKPLLMDVYNVIKWLNDNDLNRPDRYTTYVRTKPTEVNLDELEGYVTINPSFHKLWYKTVRETKFRAVVRLDYTLVNPLLATLSQLGITNPAYLAWAWKPYTFVLDWFIPISDYLGAWDATLGWLYRGGSLTEVTDSKVRLIFPIREEFYKYSPATPVPGESTMEMAFVDEPKYKYMVRTVYAASPLPQLPGFNPYAVDFKRFVSALSLLRQRMLS